MTKRLAYAVPVGLFAALVIALAMGLGHDPRLLPSALIDRPAPDFALPGLDGAPHGLARKDLGPGVTVINFFASWCVPCREEAPRLMQLAAHRGLTLDGISYKDKSEDSRRFLATYGNPFRHIGVDRDGTTGIDFGVYGVPETYVVDGSGRIRYRHVGPLSADDVDGKLLPIISRLSARGAE
jgi:cytochrome c biogenesis protein CcmG/thiol:disulfide interchange protein DsbE